jgi:pimeloyl-ACP methyl ester carboxylesterase
MAQTPTATVVLVPGAGAGAWCWSLLARELEARDIRHVEVDLPTMDPAGDPSANFHTDAAHVRALLDALDGPVVLCGNSYGGVVITEASAGHPRVERLVYLAAFMPDADEAIVALMLGNVTAEFSAGLAFGADGRIAMNPQAARRVVFPQASDEVAEWAIAQMTAMALGPGGSPTVTGVGWKTIPTTYVVSGEDGSIRPDSQRQWAERAADHVELPFDHCPQVSHPADVAELLERLVR